MSERTNFLGEGGNNEVGSVEEVLNDGVVVDTVSQGSDGTVKVESETVCTGVNYFGMGPNSDWIL